MYNFVMKNLGPIALVSGIAGMAMPLIMALGSGLDWLLPLFPLFSLAAVVSGALGLLFQHKGKTWMAAAGLVLGVVFLWNYYHGIPLVRPFH